MQAKRHPATNEHNQADSIGAPQPFAYLARTGTRGRQFWSIAVKPEGISKAWETRNAIAVTRARVKSKAPLSLVGSGGQEQRVMGFEPTTFTLAT